MNSLEPQNVKIYGVQQLDNTEKEEKEAKIRSKYNDARAYYSNEKYDEAKVILDNLIQEHPYASPDFYTLRGAIHQARNQLDDALNDIEKATNIPTGDKINYQVNLIKILNQINTTESLGKAENIIRKNLTKNPKWDEGYFMLIQKLLMNTNLDKYIQARTIFKQFLQIYPDIQQEVLADPERLSRTRNVFMIIGRMNIHFWFMENAGFILQGLCLDLSVEEQVRRGLRESIHDALVWQPSKASFIEAVIYRSLEVNHPEVPLFALLQVDCFPKTNNDIIQNRLYNDRNLEIMARAYNKKQFRFENLGQMFTSVPQALTYYYAYHNRSNATLFTNINKFMREICPDLNYVSQWLNPNGKPKKHEDVWSPTCGRKLRIGFLSKYLSTAHSVLRDRSGIILNLFHKHNNMVDVSYYIFDEPDSLGKNLASLMKDKCKILPRNVVLQRETLDNDKLDVLVFCEIGMDVYTYYLSFGRYAPLQINTWGHSDTSGQSSIDYYYSSKWYDTDDSFQSHYSEKLVRMNSLCTFYHDPLEWVTSGFRWKTREEYGFSNMNHIYYCCQSIFKISPDFDKVISEILFKDPYAIIVIIDSYGLKDELIKIRWEKKMGVNMGRVHFMNKVPFAEFLNIINFSDVLLDSYPFGGCNSSLEAFRLGKIVVSTPGEMLNGRFTMGFYNKMGVTDPIAKDLDEFVEKAVLYGTDRQERERVENLIKDNYLKLFYESDSVVEWKEQMIQDYLKRVA